jgi:hypothetical protein
MEMMMFMRWDWGDGDGGVQGFVEGRGGKMFWG